MVLAGKTVLSQYRAMSLRHRLFAYLLLLRRPVAVEQDDIDESLTWMRRNAIWLVAAYLLTLIFAVGPAFTRDYDLPYRVIALVGTHVLLWSIGSTFANCWVGFREPARPRRSGWALVSDWPMRRLVSTVAAALLGFALLSNLDWNHAIRRWAVDIGSGLLLPAFLMLLLIGIPDLVSKLRRRERAVVTRALAAEASSERLARQTAESELRLLQAQVEPHFLYNTLANLRYLVQKNSTDALRMTDALIEYLRTSVPDMRAQRVALGREVDHARHYLEIMQLRMGGRLAFVVDVPEELRPVEVPPLTLLTLVENAVKHGIAPRVEGGSVLLRARDGGDCVEIEVSDTGRGLAGATEGRDPASTGVGLDNLRGRLQLAYAEPVLVDIAANVPRRTRVTMRMPRQLPGRSQETIGAAAQARVMAPGGASFAGLPSDETKGAAS